MDSSRNIMDIWKEGDQKEIKFEYFITGLSFAIIGLSLQTIPSHQCICLKICEFLGLLGALLSGALGLIILRDDFKTYFTSVDFSSAEMSDDSIAVKKAETEMAKILIRLKRLPLIRYIVFLTSILFLFISRAVAVFI